MRGTSLCAWSEVCVGVCARVHAFFLLPRGQLNLGHFSTRNKLSLPHQGLAVNFSPSKALVARKEPHQNSWCGPRMAKEGRGLKNKHLPKSSVSPGRRGWWGCQAPEVQASSLPHPALPFAVSLGECWSSLAAASSWTLACSKQAGWVFLVGPRGAWEEMKMRRFFLTV